MTTGKHAHRRRGATSIEYLMVLTFVVLPIALTTPIMFRMITLYTGRLIWSISLPFG